jgi:CDP-diglyceride synthetase
LSLGLQGLLLGYDEIVLHRQREMPKWERWGHPIDSFFFLLPILLAALWREQLSGGLYIGLAILSCLVITKDEWIHVGRVGALESTLHAFLFLLHPVTLYWGYQCWLDKNFPLLQLAAGIQMAVLALQAVYWNFISLPSKKEKETLWMRSPTEK